MMSIKNNLYKPVSIILDSKRSLVIGGKQTLEIELNSKTDHMIQLEKLNKIKISGVTN